VIRYQKVKTNLDFTEARDSEWQWHQLGHMQVCTSLHTDNHASTHHSVFLQVGCPSWRPANSVKALKAIITYTKSWFLRVLIFISQMLYNSHTSIFNSQKIPGVYSRTPVEMGRGKGLCHGCWGVHAPSYRVSPATKCRSDSVCQRHPTHLHVRDHSSVSTTFARHYISGVFSS